jgi:hypothetical protein
MRALGARLFGGHSSSLILSLYTICLHYPRRIEVRFILITHDLRVSEDYHMNLKIILTGCCRQLTGIIGFSLQTSFYFSQFLSFSLTFSTPRVYLSLIFLSASHAHILVCYYYYYFCYFYIHVRLVVCIFYLCLFVYLDAFNSNMEFITNDSSTIHSLEAAVLRAVNICDIFGYFEQLIF